MQRVVGGIGPRRLQQPLPEYGRRTPTLLEAQRGPQRLASDIEPTIARAAKEGMQAMAVAPSTMLAANSQRVVDAMAKARMPAIYPNSEFANLGGVLSYGPDLRVAFTLMGAYVARILKGAKPADLPVEQSEKYELVANVAAAKRQGITIPQDVLGLADRVIDS